MFAQARRSSLWLTLVLVAAAWLWPGTAKARFYNEGDKAGPLIFNLKIGPAIDADGYTATQFMLQLEFGGALDPGRHAYLTFPLTFQFGSYGGGGGCISVDPFTGQCIEYGGGIGVSFTTIMVPLAFQYDIPIRPVPGLYLYPRAQVGYAAFIVGDGGGTSSFGFVAPEFGVKYVLHRRWNFGGEPFSLPIFFNGNGHAVQYRLTFYGGVNF